MFHWVPLVGALLSLGNTTAAAQDESTLKPNSRIRLSVTTTELIRVVSGTPLAPKRLTHRQFVGTLQGRRDNDIVIRVRSPESELAIPIRSVTRIEGSLGRHGRAGRGALIGMGAGLVGGVAAGFIVCGGGDCDYSGFTNGTPIVATVLGIGGVVVGAGVGAITGSLIRSERWRTVSLESLPYGDGLPRENGIRLGFAFPWKHALSFAGMEAY